MTEVADALASARAAADRLVKAKRLNACLTPAKELRKSLLAQAAAAHPSGVLYGMPVAVKDNICTLEYVAQINAVPASEAVKPFVPGPDAVRFRADEVKPSGLAFGPAEFAPAFKDGFFLVPKLGAFEEPEL